MTGKEDLNDAYKPFVWFFIIEVFGLLIDE